MTRKRAYSCWTLVTFLMTGVPFLSYAQPWASLPSETQVRLAYDSDQYDALLTADGTQEKGWGVTSHAGFLNLQHALTDNVTLGLDTGYGYSMKAGKPSTTGILDTDITLGFNLLNPYDYEGFGFGLRATYRHPGTYKVARVPHGLGKGVRAASFEATAAYQIASIALDASLGYRHSGYPAPNDVFGYAGISWFALRDASISAYYSFQLALSGPDFSADVADLVTLREESHTVHSSIAYQIIESFSLELRAAHIFKGSNAPASTKFGTAIQFNF